MNQTTKQLHYPLKIYCTLLGYSMNHLHQEVYKSANVYECLMCECCNIDSKMFSLECFYLLQSKPYGTDSDICSELSVDNERTEKKDINANAVSILQIIVHDTYGSKSP